MAAIVGSIVCVAAATIIGMTIFLIAVLKMVEKTEKLEERLMEEFEKKEDN